MKEFIKTTKGKVILFVIAVLLVACGAFGYKAYIDYQESFKSSIDFKDIHEIGLSEDLILGLITWFNADTVDIVRIVDANGAVVDKPTVGKYTIVFEAVRNGKATEFKKEITFVDDIAPVIENVVPEVEIDYGTEYNPEGNVKAIDNVDGEVELVINKLESSTPQKIMIEYFAKDTAGNETRTNSIINVKAPACAVNASFNWKTGDCGCDAGYTGDGWSACTVEKKVTSSSGSKNTSSSGGTGSKNTGGNSSVSSGNSSGNSSNEGWTVDDPTVGRVPDNVVNDCNQNYNGSCAGLVFGDGSYVIGQ